MNNFKNFFKILILILMFSFLPITTNAQIPFGGRVLASYECTCSGGWLVYFYDFFTRAPLPIVFQFGISRLNQNFNFFTPGVSVLGTYTPGGICSMGTSGCFTVPVVGTITSYPFSGIGTSAF
jgi:hypothetical protein